ncbi:MAG TPA: ABC transporter ATP-binding protein [Bryobacteraceae bacterium]|nr:ABC transporter ATP-binding protein [Bryobacteraceae bacterium]
MIYPIRTVELSKIYRGVAALEGLNLEVPENGIYGLIGPNGAGKSTTIKILMNITTAASGRAEVLGVDSTRIRANELARIGYVSEDQEAPRWMTVDGLMSYLKPFYPAWDDSLASELIASFNLPPKSRIGELSRGMRMKAALASALAYRPELLILDEPFTGLDPLVRDELIEGLLPAAEHTTTLISSHDLTEIESFVSHVGYLDQGRLRFSEEMTSLSGRFREVEIVTTGGTQPATLPKAWLNVERSGNCVRWVDSQFEHDRSMAEIQRVFGVARPIETKPMALRAIFVTLAKSKRNEA